MTYLNLQMSDQPVKDSAQSMHSAKSSDQSIKRASGSVTVRSVLENLSSGRQMSGQVSHLSGQPITQLFGLSLSLGVDTLLRRRVLSINFVRAETKYSSGLCQFQSSEGRASLVCLRLLAMCLWQRCKTCQCLCPDIRARPPARTSSKTR
jgi:hypothetical protein